MTDEPKPSEIQEFNNEFHKHVDDRLFEALGNAADSKSVLTVLSTSCCLIADVMQEMKLTPTECYALSISMSGYIYAMSQMNWKPPKMDA